MVPYPIKILIYVVVENPDPNGFRVIYPILLFIQGFEKSMAVYICQSVEFLSNNAMQFILWIH